MFRMGLRGAIGRMLDNAVISKALDEGNEGMKGMDHISYGIFKRLLDYDKEYNLNRFGFTDDQRAIAALYIYSKEVRSPLYARVEAAVRGYAAENGCGAPFAKLDSHITWVDGHMTWNH